MNADTNFILDCTLRDGGYYYNWDFDPEVVIQYLNSVASANIDYVELGKQSDENDCYLFPCTRGGIYDDKYAEEMHSFIRTNSSLIPSKSDLTIWLGITAQKRSWLEQVEGQCNLVRELNKHYPSITVIIDGWTSLADGIPDSPKDISRDMAVFDALSTRLKK